MRTDDDNLLAARFAALAPEPLAGDWDDVLGRARFPRTGHVRRARSRVRWSHRRALALALAALAVAGTASAFGTVRDLLFGGPFSASYSAPAWSPDGRRIAFVVHRYPDGGGELNVMNVNGSDRRVLTQVGFAWSQPLAWSPDGQTISFVAPWQGRFDVFVVNADGSSERRLARGVRRTRDPNTDPSPTWSPDGREIAFVTDRADTSAADARDTRDGAEIYVMSADGSGQRRVTRNAAEDRTPAWSPDGRKLAYVRAIRADNGHVRRQEIHVMNADGSHDRMLARGSAPAWSPDGRKIAFRSDRDRNGEIYVMNADGSDQRRLTHNPASDGRPVWSPDGRRILFERAEFLHGNTEIYVMNADGSGKRNLTRAQRGDASPAWSPDGRRIVFTTRRDGIGEIYLMNADGSSPVNLSQLKQPRS